MYEPDPKSVVDDVLGEGKPGAEKEGGDDLQAAMGDLAQAMGCDPAKVDKAAMAEAFRHALALADTES